VDHEVIRRYSGTNDDPGVQFLEQGEASFFRPARDERDGKETEPAKVAHQDPLGSDE
jgi:hypothetical protein